MEELGEVINVPEGEVSGPDGFKAEFFKSFATELAPSMLEVYKETLARVTLLSTLRQALTRLVPKKG